MNISLPPPESADWGREGREQSDGPFTFRERWRFLYRAWRYRLRVEPAEVRFVLRHVQAGQNCLDIGGHKGALTYWLQRAVGSSGRVLSFEPQPELARYLQRAGHTFGWHHVTVVPLALSASTGQRSLYRPEGPPSPGATLEERGAGAGRPLAVPVESLDCFLERHPLRPIHFIKCDVEGHELDVFRGAERLLTEDHPLLLFECEQRHHGDRPIRRVFQYLNALGYRGRYFQFGRLQPPGTPLPEWNVPGQRDYVNNFVFQVLDGLEQQDEPWRAASAA
jgi:FkbM family methyltransferase